MVNPEFADTATIIAAQLAAFGINAELLQVDAATGNTTLADPGAWDMYFGLMAGDYNVQAWAHDFSYNNSSSGTETTTHIVDDEWNDLLNLCNTADGHTAVHENRAGRASLFRAAKGPEARTPGGRGKDRREARGYVRGFDHALYREEVREGT